MRAARVPSWVWVVLVLAHVFMLAWVVPQNKWVFTDSGRYIQAATNIWEHGQLYARPWPLLVPTGAAIQEYTIRPVGYPLVILGLGGAAGHPVLLLLVQNLASLLNIGLVLRGWARWARPTPGEWGMAVAGVLTFPAQLIYANAVMSEILLQSCVVAMVAAAMAFVQHPRARYLGVVALAIGAAPLLKPVFYPLAFGVALVAACTGWRYRRPVIVAIGLLPVGIVGLYMGWNQQRTGYFHFSSIAEINLLQYNAAGVLRQLEGLEAEEKWVGQVLDQADAEPDFAARQRYIQQQATAMLTAHIGVYARQQAQGMAAFVLDPGRFDLGQVLGWNPPTGGGLLTQARQGRLWQAATSLPWGQLLLLGLVGLTNLARLGLAVRGFKRLRYGCTAVRYGRWVALGMLLYVAALTGPLGAARFLVPVWPLLFGLALAGLRWPEPSPKPAS